MNNPLNPYEPVQLAREEFGATRHGFGRSLFANWFTKNLLWLTLLLGILGFFECAYRNSYLSVLQIFGSLLVGLRHLGELSSTKMLIRTVVELGLAYVTTIALFYVVIIALMLFVPGALSH